jgi:hypothetical protein
MLFLGVSARLMRQSKALAVRVVGAVRFSALAGEIFRKDSQEVFPVRDLLIAIQADYLGR